MPSRFPAGTPKGKDRCPAIHTHVAIDLEVRHLRHFVAVAEELSFTRAAERLHMAQPALSTRIRELERRLGVTLLERTTRRVALTPAGVELLDRARTLLADHASAVLAVREAGGAATVLRIGLLGSAGSELIGPTLRRMAAARPEVELEPKALDRPSQVEHGEVDVAFARLLPAETSLEVNVLGYEPRLLALAADHPLAARDELHMADLAAEAFLTEAAHANPRWREQWLAEQRRHGLEGRIAAEVSDAAQLFALLAAGRGVCLVPSAAARAMARPGIAFVPVLDAEPAAVSLVWRRHAPASLVSEFARQATLSLAAASQSAGTA